MPAIADDPWANARTLPDLCDLTVQWLRGAVRHQPCYPAPVDVNERDAPGLTNTLIALNRAGFLTEDSRAGFDGVGYDGAHWQCRATVSGFADTAVADRITHALRDTRFQVIRNPLHRVWRRRFPGVPVTTREGVTVGVSGRQLGARDVADVYQDCHRQAIDAVCAAWRVTVYDPRFGSNGLWPALRDAIDRDPGRTAFLRRAGDRSMRTLLTTPGAPFTAFDWRT